MENKEESPQWLSDINSIIQDANKKITDIEDAIKKINYDKGPRLELRPPGAPPTFGRSHHGQQMEQFYRQQISDIKKVAWERSNELYKNVDDRERERYETELKEKLAAYQQKEEKDLPKENQEHLNKSQGNMMDMLQGYKKRISEKEKNQEEKSKTQEHFQSKEITSADSFKRNLIFTKMQDNKSLTEKEKSEVVKTDTKLKGVSEEKDRE